MTDLNIVCLAGGVGGAKLAHGLAQIVPPERLTIIVNTGDDFQHLGLTICPDLDTVMYALAGCANAETGWGRAGESFRAMEEVRRLGGPDWFRLGDLDLATHLTRSHLLAQGQTLTAVTRHLCRQLGIQPDVLPMSNQPAPTFIQSGTQQLPFQTWFVAERWQPPVDAVVLPDMVQATAQVAQKLEKADVVVLAPSNPFVSLDPILNVYPIREMVMDLPQAVVAVSPIVGGQAVKGPAAKMMQERGLPVSATAVRDYFGDLLDGFVYDVQDAGAENPPAGLTLCVDTMMHNDADRRRLAQDVLSLAQRIITATAV
ncbi:MAG: 2-phospho-L-lactate transferase [Ardenticatenaceae bacterium]|nr:2-phospho-L-lactate transferase [Ardenticatenaceae bacterium]